MKRMRLRAILYSEIGLAILEENGNFEKGVELASINLAKFIGLYYRRRKYHIRQYTCNSCGLTLKAGKICQCLILKRGRK